MSDGSAIEWTDATWNPVRGCTKVSPGCKHSYAETFAERFRGVPDHPFQQGFGPVPKERLTRERARRAGTGTEQLTPFERVAVWWLNQRLARSAT